MNRCEYIHSCTPILYIVMYRPIYVCRGMYAYYSYSWSYKAAIISLYVHIYAYPEARYAKCMICFINVRKCHEAISLFSVVLPDKCKVWECEERVSFCARAACDLRS